MKRLLVIIFGLLALAMLAVMIYIATIDWNKHKNIIAEQFNLSTGRKIVFEGPISFNVFPKPSLKASNVKIFNDGGNGAPLVEIPSLLANLSLFPLFEGKFEVQKMNLQNSKINVEILPDGKINWQSDLSPEQRRNVEEAKFTLNSVNLQNATVNYDDQIRDIGFKLENLNGEVFAQSVMGPYRFDGNYVKDNNPEGFAISMGKLSDSMATSLNMVITHPMSESYVRFDGSFMIGNRILGGNLIVESKKLRQFVEANLKSLNFAPQYDNSLVLTSDINLNAQQLSLTNMVLRYGESQGAGTAQLLFNDGFGSEGNKPRIDLAFNFTDLDLTPFAKSLKQFVEELYSGEKQYNPKWPVDVLVDIKSLRTFYNNQQIKNFEFSADMVANIFTLNNLAATVPGDSDVKFKGTVSSVDDKLFYNMNSYLTAKDFLKTLNWLKLNPIVSAASTYRKASIEAGLSGTLQQLYIKPLVVSVDKSSFSGEVGINFGDRNDVMATLNADMINFDNYIPNLPAEEKEKPWRDRNLYRFSKLGWLNDFDLQLNANMNLAIYDSIPFEKLEAKFNLLDGKMRLEKFQTSSLAGAKVVLSGEVSGFGGEPKFSEFNYDVETKDLNAFVNKLGFNVPKLDYAKNRDFSMQGAVSGDLAKIATQMHINWGDLFFSYSGQVDKTSQNAWYNGEMEFRHPDFMKMLNDLNVEYYPSGANFGAVEWKSNLEGAFDNMRFQNMLLNIGVNNFKGDLSYVSSEKSVPQVKTSLEINRFELDRFLPKNIETKSQPVLNLEANDSNVEFLTKPIWSKKLINYDVFQKFNLDGSFKISEFIVQKYAMNNVETNIVLNNGSLDVMNYKGEYLGAGVEANLKLQMQSKPQAEVSLILKNLEISKIRPIGDVYGVNTGKMDMSATVSGAADSEASFWQSLKGDASFAFDDIAVKGWNLQAIYDDIVKRERSEGLNAEIANYLRSGSSDFSKFDGKLSINNGVMRLVDVKMLGANNVVTLNGEFTPINGDMDVGFSVKYDEPKYIPLFEFSLKGEVDKPALDVNVDALFEFYKAKEDKKQAEIIAEKNAEVARLTKEALEYYKAADALITTIRNDFEREVTDTQMSAFSEDARAKYGDILLKSDAIVKSLAQNLSLAQEPDMNEEMLQKIADINNKKMAEIENLKYEFAKVKEQDAKMQMQDLYRDVVKKYNQAKVYDQSYNELRDKYAKRLSVIVTDFVMEDDTNISGWQNFIEDKIKAFRSEDVALLDKMQNIQEEQNYQVVEEYIQKLKELNDVLDTDLKALAESLKDYEDYAEKKVAAQENAYAKSLRQEEVERKLEENTGSIIIKKSGKVVTVRRSIEDIEKAEKQSANEVVKVLDFSEQQVDSKMEENANSNVNVVKKGRVSSY